MASSKYFSPASLEERKEGVQLLPPPAPKKLRREGTLPRSPSCLLPPPSPPVPIPQAKNTLEPTSGLQLWRHYHRPHLDKPYHMGLPELKKEIGDHHYIEALGKYAIWDPVMKRYRLPPLEPIPEVEE